MRTLSQKNSATNRKVAKILLLSGGTYIGFTNLESAPEYTQLTYFGDLPEHAVFEFKVLSNCVGLESCKENYIILPLDTNIKTNVQLCTVFKSKGIMTDGDMINKWDPQKQEKISLGRCDSRLTPINLEPGKEYIITIKNQSNWIQE